MQRVSCNHLSTATNIPLTKILSSIKELKCADCECPGPNLWICLYDNCLKIGCSEKSNDHSTLHNANQPSHCIHMNVSTKRIWCYECKSEVFLDAPTNSCNDSDYAEEETCAYRSRDSGHGSYSTLRTTTPERTNEFGFERTVGLNVGMSGDTSESSDDEDENCYSIDRPYGLVGLQNIGNTCYMNAALQALSNTEPLTKFFLDCATSVHLLSEGRKPGLSRTYQTLMNDIWIKKNGGYVTPAGILYGIRNVHAMFRGYHQHDTQEFLRNFMDQLHEELKQMSAPEPTPTSDSSDTFSLAMDEPAMSSSYDSSEGEYETCDSGVSERSSLSDETEKPFSSAKRRLSRCGSPNRRQRQRIQTTSVIDSQPSTSSSVGTSTSKKQQKYRSIISDIFDGKLLSSVQCLTCDRVSSRVETFQDLSLPIPSRDHLMLLHGRTMPGTTCSEAVLPVQDGWVNWILAWLRSWFYGPTVTLHDCLAAFFSTDELKGDNMYSCEKCNKLRNGIKFSKVLQLPEVLCIHLKRFRHELMFSSKISSAVSFPLKGLDMRPYLHSDCTSKVTSYELFSVICHHGTAGGGHYICFALNSGQWYEFDDQYVTKVNSEKVQNCEAYVLFYRKVTTTTESVKNEVFSLVEECQEDTLKRVLISRQWLNRFNYCAEAGPIDNTDFLCQHGSINPERQHLLSQLSIMVPIEVYDYLYKQFGGCPPLANVQICPACLSLQKRILHEMETFVQLNREGRINDLPHTHYLSTSWYTQWHNFIQKHNQEVPGPIDNSKINLNNLDLNEAAEVTEDIWNFFYNTYGGGPEIKIKPAIPLPPPPDSEDEKDVFRSPCEDEAPSFTIPQLKRDNHDNKIDKTMYSHGEPMDTECVVQENVEVKPEESTNLPMDVDILKNGHVVALTNGNRNPNIDDDIEEEEANEIRNSKKHRRRRKNVTSL